MSLALLFVPALLAIAAIVWRWRSDPPPRILLEPAPAPATISGDADPLAAIDALLVELERATVRIDGSDELDPASVAELERLADRLVAAAAALEDVG